MKWVGVISAMIGGIVIGYLLVSLGVVDVLDGVSGTLEEPAVTLPTYMSFVGVMLTAVTVVLAALAIGIGIVAAYTFRELKDEAQKTASATAKEIADDALSEVKVRKMVLDLYAKAEEEREAIRELGGEENEIENEER